MVKTYIRKPFELQAIQWTGDNIDEIIEFIKEPLGTSFVNLYELEHWLQNHHNYYISRSSYGEMNTWGQEDFERLFVVRED